METWRTLSKNDLFFLLVYCLGRKDAFHPWIFERCREYQANPWGYIDLWARGHYKSTIITFAHTIMEMINEPELTHVIFSHTKGIAQDFVSQIKSELENNKLLVKLFPDVFYENPEKESPKWSEQDGIVIKRKGNPKELTLEGWGVVDNQPTGRHFDRLKYDDLVTVESVNTPEQILKTTERYKMSLNLGSSYAKKAMIGTFYAHNDTYNFIIEEGSVAPRIYPAMTDKQDFSTSVFLTPEKLMEKRRDMGVATFGTQMLLDPSVANNKAFERAWFKYWHGQAWNTMNRYIVVDPSSGKSKKSDYTVILVIGLGRDKNYYVIDAIRDRLNLGQRTKMLFRLVEQYTPLEVFYEEYGLQADKEHIEGKMKDLNFRFNITSIGGSMPKKQRILRLQPDFEKGKIFFPTNIMFTTVDGDIFDFTALFLKDEYINYPAVEHDDMLDSLARIYDFDGSFPSEKLQSTPVYVDDNVYV